MFFGKPGLVVSSSPCSTSPTIPVLQEIQLGECIGRERQPGHVHFMPFFWVQYTKSKNLSEPGHGRLGSPTKPAKISTFRSGMVECTGTIHDLGS
jgi:hypothetical protein